MTKPWSLWWWNSILKNSKQLACACRLNDFPSWNVKTRIECGRFCWKNCVNLGNHHKMKHSNKTNSLGFSLAVYTSINEDFQWSFSFEIFGRYQTSHLVDVRNHVPPFKNWTPTRNHGDILNIKWLVRSLISERNQFLGKPRVSHLCATPQAQAGERTVREVLDTVPRSQSRDGYFGPRDSRGGTCR